MVFFFLMHYVLWGQRLGDYPFSPFTSSGVIHGHFQANVIYCKLRLSFTHSDISPRPPSHCYHLVTLWTFIPSLGTWDADYWSPPPTRFSVILPLSFWFLGLNSNEFSFHIISATHSHVMYLTYLLN